MVTILVFIAVLGLLVLVHELGHFWAAKKAGCGVDEFGIGFPPRLWSFTYKGTLYSINLFPIGGFVKIQGENGEENPSPRSFVTKSFGWKSLIISAGVLMNVLLAYVLITGNLIIGVPTEISPNEQFDRYATLSNRAVTIVQVLPDSPAADAGLQAGDRIVAIDGVQASNVDETISVLGNAQMNALQIEYLRGDVENTVTVTPVILEELGKSGVGVGLTETATLSYPWYSAWWYGAKRTVLILWLILQAFGGMIANIFTKGSLPSDVAGPIGIAVITGEVARLGITHLVQFAALLSLNLAIINILPLPALDGGRLALIVLERLRGKKMKVFVEQWIHILGFAFLIVLMIAVTARDLFTYGGGIWQTITNLF